MKAIIDGLRYNTEAPKTVKVGEERASCSVTDFQYWEAALYRTGGRRYFLAGEGGPMSRFARPVDGNSMTGGSKIIPMTKEEALEWAERYLDAETVENEFPDMVEEA